MRIFELVKRLFTNKVTIYLTTRYIVYGVTFLTSLFMASRLGPYYMGIWGSIALLLKYFHVIDFGVGNSISVFLVQNKKNKERADSYEKAAVFLLACIFLFILLIGIYYKFFGIAFVEKFSLGKRFYYVLLIAVFQYFDDYSLKVYRVKGKMFEFTLYQTFHQVLMFPAIFFAKEDALVDLLIGLYVFAHLTCALVFIFRGGLSFGGKLKFDYVKDIIVKGFFLFVYNASFYFIILSTKTIVGSNYTVAEFGKFSFAYTLAHAALMLLTAFSALITPRLLDKFNTDDKTVIKQTVEMLRANYVSLAHGMMYLSMCFFPILLMFLPKYADSLRVINFTSLAVLLYSNSFGYISLLMAKNKEKSLAYASIFCLLLNIVLALLLVKVINVGYEYVILATLVTYFIYAIIIIKIGQSFIGIKKKIYEVIKEAMPLGMLVPFVISCILTVVNVSYLMPIPLIIFVLLNWQDIGRIIGSIKRITYNPNIVDVK